MNRYASDNRPRVKPVKKIELDGKNTKRRVILAALFACVGISALIYGFMQLLGTEAGWDTIKPLSSSAHNCGADFLFQYDLGTGEVRATKEKKELQELYTRACEKAYWLFNVDEVPEDEELTEPTMKYNLCYINGHPGETVEVDPVLYQAFKKVKDYKNRLIYLGPLYNRYDDIFYCQSDEQAEEHDPYRNEETAEEYGRLAAYGRDSSKVDIELLSKNHVRLKVAEDYKKFLDNEQGQNAYVDFFWFKNGFIIDYLADTLAERGYIKGALNSVDGYVRNLGGNNENKFGINIYDIDEKHIIEQPATLEYSGEINAACLREYRHTKSDYKYYYEYEDGETRNCYISIKDGKCHSLMHDLTLYSKETSCSEILLEAADLWIDGEKSQLPEELKRLREKNIDAAWVNGGKVEHTGDYVKIILNDKN